MIRGGAKTWYPPIHSQGGSKIVVPPLIGVPKSYSPRGPPKTWYPPHPQPGATHLFRECWAEGTGSDTDICLAFGWEVESHKFKVAMAAETVAIAHNARITVDVGNKEVSVAGHARSVAAS
jgi:hypothetical protein